MHITGEGRGPGPRGQRGGVTAPSTRGASGEGAGEHPGDSHLPWHHGRMMDEAGLDVVGEQCFLRVFKHLVPVFSNLVTSALGDGVQVALQGGAGGPWRKETSITFLSEQAPEQFIMRAGTHLLLEELAEPLNRSAGICFLALSSLASGFASPCPGPGQS